MYIVYCVGKMFVFTLLNVLPTCSFIMIVTADLERLQHAGHVLLSHEVDGKHNVEFDHEAILGVYFADILCFYGDLPGNLCYWITFCSVQRRTLGDNWHMFSQARCFLLFTKALKSLWLALT